MLSIVAVLINIPPTLHSVLFFFFFFSKSCLHVISCVFVLFCFYFFGNSHSNECEVVSHCGFICPCLMISDVEHLFTSLLVICIFSWEDMQVVCQFFNWILLLPNCLISLYISDVTHFQLRGFKCFLPFHSLPFHFVDCIFVVQNLLV